MTSLQSAKIISVYSFAQLVYQTSIHGLCGDQAIPPGGRISFQDCTTGHGPDLGFPMVPGMLGVTSTAGPYTPCVFCFHKFGTPALGSQAFFFLRVAVNNPTEPVTSDSMCEPLDTQAAEPSMSPVPAVWSRAIC